VKTSLRPALGLAIAFLALHLPFPPGSLEDLDSINFALGLHQFDVAQHQPHPPGYPVFIVIGRLVNAVSSSEARALSFVSMVSGALALLAVGPLFARWTSGDARGSPALVGPLIVASTPIFWMTAARPLSDMAGLAAVLGVQLLTMRATSPAGFAAAAFCAGMAAGIRSQVVWLTLPLLAAALFAQRRDRSRSLSAAIGGVMLGGLAWGVPLVLLSGGPAAYIRALTSQGAEDFTGVAMLVTQPSPRLLLSALYASFVAPFGSPLLAAAVLLAAGTGAIVCGRHDRPALLWLLVAFGPYAAFHLLFQETATTRYALPLVPAFAYLAARGLSALPRRLRAPAPAAMAAAGLAIAMPPLAAYARVPSPAFRVLDDMRTAQSAAAAPAHALWMHRRQELDMRRPLVWNRTRLPAWTARLPAPPKREWMELVKYWNDGGRAPIWLLADPPRSDLHLVDPRSMIKRGEYRWPFDASSLLGGVRPNVLDWYEVVLPAWYLGEGWALTPETAGFAREVGRGPGRAPIEGWVRREDRAATLMIGGRNLAGSGGSVPISVAIDGKRVFEATAAPGFFLHFVPIAAGALAGPGDYATLAVSAGGGEAIAIEQFDLRPTGDLLYGFDDGWQELEYNPRTGRLWRWSSEQSVIRVRASPQPLTLHLDGAFETSARTAHVIVRAGGRMIAERDVPRAFTLDIPVEASAIDSAGETLLTIETDQWYVPAETNWRPTQDRRHLGLRLYECRLMPAS